MQLGEHAHFKAAEMFVSSRSMKSPWVHDLGESFDLGVGLGAKNTQGECAAFYSMANPKAKKWVPKKKIKAAIPPPVEQLVQVDEGIGKEGKPQPQKARNARDLRVKVDTYLQRMARRAVRISRDLKREVRHKLNKASTELKKLKTTINNAQNLVKAEITRMGTEQSLVQGQCLQNACYRGITFDAYQDGKNQRWMCRRGMNGKQHTRNAFSCEMKTAKGDIYMCRGKEVWFGRFWVPFIKELRCAKDIKKSCYENKQCGTDALPLTSDLKQSQLRIECAQL